MDYEHPSSALRVESLTSKARGRFQRVENSGLDALLGP
jgi:hypothetical protein